MKYVFLAYCCIVPGYLYGLLFSLRATAQLYCLEAAMRRNSFADLCLRKRSFCQDARGRAITGCVRDAILCLPIGDALKEKYGASYTPLSFQ